MTSTIDRELDTQRYVELLQDKTVYRDDVTGLKPDGWEDMSSSYDVVYTYTLYYQGISGHPLPHAVIGVIDGRQFNEDSEMGRVNTSWRPLADNDSSHIIIRITRLLTNKVFSVDGGYVSLGATMEAVEQFNNDAVNRVISLCAELIATSPRNEVGAASPVLMNSVRSIKWITGGMAQEWVAGDKEGELVLSETIRTQLSTTTRETNIDTGEQTTTEMKAVDVHLEETRQADPYRELPETEPAPMVDLYDSEYEYPSEPEPAFDEQAGEDAFTAGRPRGFFATAVDSVKSIFNSLFRR